MRESNKNHPAEPSQYTEIVKIISKLLFEATQLCFGGGMVNICHKSS